MRGDPQPSPEDRANRARALDLIRAGQRFLVTCHVRPDADALGSALGLAATLRVMGKEAVVYSHGGVPSLVTFLEGSESVIGTIPDGVFDATFITDTAARELVPPLPPRERTGPVVMIDHHAAHDDYGDFAVREIDAIATGELILRMVDDLGVELPRVAAQPLYAAIVADTGGFRYAGTTPTVLRLGARLLDLGVDPWQVASNLFERWPPQRMKLLAEVLATLEMHAGGRIATTYVERAMLARAGAADEMIEGMVNYGRMLDGVAVAILVWETATPGGVECKVSLRGALGADVSKIAVALGGGGHRNAAGATLRIPLAEARAKVLAEAQKLLS